MRRAVRSIVQVCGQVLLCFHLSDTHVHVVVLAERARAGRLAQALCSALAPVVGTALPGAGLTPILDDAHLRATFAYVLCNDERHGVAPDPWHENSNLPDLLGVRITAASTITVTRAALPRVDGGLLRDLAGWPRLAGPLDTATVRAHLADAAAAVVARGALGSRHDDVMLARRAAVAVGAACAVGAAELASLVGIGRKTLGRLAATPPPPALRAALEQQLRMRAAVPLAAEHPFGDELPPAPWRGSRHRGTDRT